MPDDQTVSHYQSIFDQKNHLNFLALVESKIAGIVFKTCIISEQQINPKVLSVADFCHNYENSKNGKNSFVENARPLGTTPTNSLPAPWQKIGCKSTRVGANFDANPRGCAGGEWLWQKLIAA